jgi:DNA-binding response OmpR family regulator
MLFPSDSLPIREASGRSITTAAISAATSAPFTAAITAARTRHAHAAFHSIHLGLVLLELGIDGLDLLRRIQQRLR